MRIIEHVDGDDKVVAFKTTTDIRRNSILRSPEERQQLLKNHGMTKTSK